MKTIAVAALLISAQALAYPTLNLNCDNGAVKVGITYFEHGVSVANVNGMELWNSDYALSVTSKTYTLNILVDNELGLDQLICVEAPRVEAPSYPPYGGHYPY